MLSNCPKMFTDACDCTGQWSPRRRHRNWQFVANQPLFFEPETDERYSWVHMSVNSVTRETQPAREPLFATVPNPA